MPKSKKREADYENPIEIAEGIHWVGFYDRQSGLHCNPYLIIDNNEALVIDGGSRPDFPTVMMKILQTGIAPNQIKALLYQHYDPDLCGSIPNFEGIIKRPDLKIISETENLMFIRHYSVSSRLFPLDAEDFKFEFSSGRTLQFITTPYAHSAGSFVTFDPKSKIIFSSDLFGSYGSAWELFLELKPECIECVNLVECPKSLPNCPINDILDFHMKIMPSRKALMYALKKILEIPFEKIAPQHGSIVKDKKALKFLFKLLMSLKDVGIDGIVDDDNHFNFADLDHRFKP
ncbi:MAG: MBL fold metallo-hydrolase [Deltaproteobacteria bacterium]|nr:MBL fold metallo-hydrolase [Deltaproteobacteria bacterium]